MVPAAGAGKSTVTLSVSILTMISSRETCCPSDFSQSPICTSVIDSPTGGTFSSIGIFQQSLRNPPLLSAAAIHPSTVDHSNRSQIFSQGDREIGRFWGAKPQRHLHPTRQQRRTA